MFEINWKTEDRKQTAEKYFFCPLSSVLCLLSSVFCLLSSVFCILFLVSCPKKTTLPPEASIYHNNKGVVYLSDGDFERAEFSFKTALELNPKYAEAYNNLGIVYKGQGNLDKAVQMFQKSIEIDNDYASAHNHLGATYLAQGKTDDAIKELKKAEKGDPASAEIKYNLGVAHFEKKEFGEAEKKWKEATTLNPDLEPVHLRLAEWYREQHKYDLAIIRYRLALTAVNKPATWVRMGTLYLEMQDPFKAQNAFQKALETDSANIDALLYLGQFYLDQNRYEEAAEQFQLVTEVEPHQEMGFFRLGTAYLKQAEEEGVGASSPLWLKAAEALEKAKGKNPAFSDASYNLGWAYLKAGKEDPARSAWEYTLVIAADHPQTLYNLGMLDQQQNKKGGATKNFCRFLKVGSNDFPVEAGVAR